MFMCWLAGSRTGHGALAVWKKKRRSAAFHKPAWGQPEISGSGFDFFEIRAGQKHSLTYSAMLVYVLIPLKSGQARNPDAAGENVH